MWIKSAASKDQSLDLADQRSERHEFCVAKERRTFVQIVIHTEKKYSHALLSASALSVRCGAMKKQKKQQLPISQRRDNKKSEIAKEESRKVKLKKARWRHFYHNTSCNILWFSFEDYLLIRLQKSQKLSEKKIEKIWPEVESCSGSHQDTSREIHHIVRVGRHEA